MLGAKTCRFGSGATALLCAVLCGGVLSAQEGQNARWYYAYYICAGDVLQISVYQHPEFSKTVVVRSNGDINLPWLNAAKVAGLSVQAASDLLRQKLQSVVDKSVRPYNAKELARLRCVTVTVKRRKGPLVLEKEPFFIDVPPPDQFYAPKNA
jgi:protein involved in polysaccharide export with SLBB domain